MELTENFVAAIRPISISRICVNVAKKGAGFEVHGPYKSGEPKAPVDNYASEEALWIGLSNTYPGAVEELRSNAFITYRGFAQRSDIITTFGMGPLAAMEQKVKDTVVLMHDTVITALAAERATRTEAQARRTNPSRSASMWHTSCNLILPFAPKDRVYMVVSAFPCALDPNAWTMRVRMDTTSNEMMLESQNRIAVAIQMLADKGIVIRDTLCGSTLADIL